MPISAWGQLELFVRSETGARKVLTRQLTLEKDLDLTGDDADDFMGKFFEKFEVKHGDFDLNRYFSGEGFNPFVIIGFLFSRKLRQQYEKVPLTLSMLEKAIEAGIWKSGSLEKFGDCDRYSHQEPE
ncbi:acyl carrier protein [Caballeronia pedi]|uniref:Acyl carrier protein n=1 Tax=Caballeronia pedi TaxID=1777141 RepID=A0A157Z6D4_9BURK|nr:DUF1493 family protein [Caballeronia pedi]SAK41062.1 acyl carrier protein [Caballeronia pedi]